MGTGLAYRLAVDIGGTFTDFALFYENSGRVATHKQLTTPEDPSIAVIEGTRILCDKLNVPIDQITAVVHGTTLVTNAVIERNGAVTGMLVTAGFRDVVDIARERRYDLFDLRLTFPSPLIPRSLRSELAERVSYDGTVERSLSAADAIRAISDLVVTHQIKALAVCLLHSYANPCHEDQIRALAAERFPELFVSTSADVFPFMREYERWTTTTINAYVQPMVERYLARLETELNEQGFNGKIYIMSSNGGTMTPPTARRFPVRLLESGPAAGVLMSAYHGRVLNRPNILSFDMGGTTAKGALIRDGEPLKEYSMEIARVHQFKAGSGLPVKIPVIDMIEIGAGGGSIAEIDERDVMRVGPRSAGADPGPACYGRGGNKPTLTDANLLLGYLNPGYFLGGEMPLDPAASERVIADGVGHRLGLDRIRAAWGIHEIINEDVCRAFRVHAAERGFDYRGCTMIAFGGGGPIHALRIARKLRIPRVIFPVGAGVMSAFGLLVSPLSFEIVKSDPMFLNGLTAETFVKKFEPLIDQTAGFLRQAGMADEDIHITRRLDIRYRGQGYELEVVLPEATDASDLIRRIPSLFADIYETVFAVGFLDEPLEIVNWKVEATGPVPKIGEDYPRIFTESSKQPLKGTRRAYFPEEGDYVDCPVYDRYALIPGAVLEGPALVEERESTCVIGVGERVEVDDRYNLVAELGDYGADG